MPEISLQNIDQISRDVRNQEITFSHLPEDLIDHMCCDVENEMQNGLSFPEAYKRVRQKMGSRRLKEIQEETLYAVDSKYRKMKNTMKISGVAGTIMFGFAALFKIQHWPGAGILITLGALVLAFIFLPSALVVLWKETRNTKRLFLFIAAFLTGTCFIAGTLFRIQHWPGASFVMLLGVATGILFFIPALLIDRLNDQGKKAKLPVYIIGAAGLALFIGGFFFKYQHWPLATTFMVAGLFLLSIVSFPWFTWLTWKDNSNVSSRFIFMVIGVLLVILPGALINLSLQRSYLDQYYPNNNRQTEMFNYLFTNNSSVISSLHDSSGYPVLEQLHARTKGVLEVISNIQVMMVQESEGKPGKPAVSSAQITKTEAGSEILYRALSKPFSLLPVRDYLLPGCTARQEIDLTMAGYMKYLTGIVPGEDILMYKSLLDPATYLPGIIQGKAEISLMSGLHSLEVMKTGLLTVESCVLKQIVKQQKSF
jgi:hypothetical protein